MNALRNKLFPFLCFFATYHTGRRDISVACEYVIGGNLLTLTVHNRSGNLFGWDRQYDSYWFGSQQQLNNNVHALTFDPFRRVLVAGGEFDVPYDDDQGQIPVRLRGLAVMSLAEGKWRSLGNLAINSQNCDISSRCSTVYVLSMQSNETQLAVYVGGNFPNGIIGKNSVSLVSKSNPNNVAKCTFDGASWSWSIHMFSSGTDGPVMVIAI
jgi:hypothetical protein